VQNENEAEVQLYFL